MLLSLNAKVLKMFPFSALYHYFKKKKNGNKFLELKGWNLKIFLFFINQ